MGEHPYAKLLDHAYWRRSVANVPAADVDPVLEPSFKITRATGIVTIGSCFAQHIGRYLKQRGFNYLVTEPPHGLVSEELAFRFNYGVFTARYGNVYTARQLLQLFQRAYGLLVPEEDCWELPDGRVVDPFRPQVQPGGFLSKEELLADREQHLAAVRLALEELDVLVFTLGLTECWLCRVDDVALPLCPGVAGGEYEPSKYEYQNFSVRHVVEDTLSAIDLLRTRNPGCKVLLTVSPVPLIATADAQHVLVATTYSKSVLRVAADEVARARQGVVYFPSYEIITGAFNRGSYFADDLRSVTGNGVDHVMRLFIKHFATESDVSTPVPSDGVANGGKYVREMQTAADVNCDEEALDSE